MEADQDRMGAIYSVLRSVAYGKESRATRLSSILQLVRGVLSLPTPGKTKHRPQARQQNQDRSGLGNRAQFEPIDVGHV